MRDAFEMVRAFHRQNGFSDGVPFAGLTSKVGKAAQLASAELAVFANDFLDEAKRDSEQENFLASRFHLTAEEAGELFAAASEGDEVGMADAIGDLIYVLLGHGVTWGWDIPSVVTEICLSNLTKTKELDDPDVIRLRKKGPWYVPPDIRGAMRGGMTYLRACDLMIRYGVVPYPNILVHVKAGPMSAGDVDVAASRLLGRVPADVVMAVTTAIKAHHGYSGLKPEDAYAVRGQPTGRVQADAPPEWPEVRYVPLTNGDET